MRAIHLAKMDKTRPAVVLTRDVALPHLTTISVAPISSRVHGISTEVSVGPANGLDHDCVVKLDSITTIPVANLGRQIGRLLPDQEVALREAISAAFDLVEP